MKAFQLVAQGTPGKFELRDVPEPKLKPGHAIVQVNACGLNHLDLWVEEAGLPVPVALPRTPGCEVSGVVSAIAPDSASDFNVGDRVAVQSNIFCGECEFCRAGQESVCVKGELLGVQSDGGFAEKVLVPSRCLVRLPDSVSFEDSAALTLAGSTAMHMLTDRATVRAGDWVLVMGASSGVGSAAIQIGKGLGAQVITTASSPAKRELGLRLGADKVIDLANASWPADVRAITGKRGVNLVVEHIGGEVLERCFECLARNGAIVTCGATAGQNVRLNLWPLFVKQQQLVGSYGRNRKDIGAVLDWIAAGRLKPVVHALMSLENTGQAFADLRQRRVLGKIVIKP